jgi:protein-disulfide isomerase
VSGGRAAPPPVDAARDHVRGTGARDLVLYGDYEDPRSLEAYRSVQMLEGQSLAFRLCFRHLPIAEDHPHALQAAVAAEAAHDQDRFWDMHDALFTGQRALARDDLRARARALGLDTERFDREFASDEQLARITGHVRGALEAGASSAPALFLDGRPLFSYAPDALITALRR